MKINNFWGDLSDISVEKEPLEKDLLFQNFQHNVLYFLSCSYRSCEKIINSRWGNLTDVLASCFSRKT